MVKALFSLFFSTGNSTDTLPRVAFRVARMDPLAVTASSSECTAEAAARVNRIERAFILFDCSVVFDGYGCAVGLMLAVGIMTHETICQGILCTIIAFMDLPTGGCVDLRFQPHHQSLTAKIGADKFEVTLELNKETDLWHNGSFEKIKLSVARR